MDIMEKIIQDDIAKDPLHIGTFTDEDIKRIIKQYSKPKRKSLFE